MGVLPSPETLDPNFNGEWGVGLVFCETSSGSLGFTTQFRQPFSPDGCGYVHHRSSCGG